MTSRRVIIEERGGIAGVGFVLWVPFLALTVLLLIGGIVLVFLLMYALVSWIADRIQGPDPEPSLSFWSRVKLWKMGVQEVRSE